MFKYVKYINVGMAMCPYSIQLHVITHDPVLMYISPYVIWATYFETCRVDHLHTSTTYISIDPIVG